MNLIFSISGEKIILKHFMHRTIPKKCILGVFSTAQYIFQVYFTRRSLLLTLLTYFYGYNAFGCIYILPTLKNKTKNSIHQLLYFGYMFSNGISLRFCKKPGNIHLDLNSVFSLSYKISFADSKSLFMELVANVFIFLYKFAFW